MKRALVTLFVLAACGHRDPPHAPAAGSTNVSAFVDVTVVPMDRETALPHHTVIVRDGRITAVGPSASTAVPEGAQRIDGRGKWLLPGLADMHVHTYDPRQLALFVTMGVTTIRVLWGEASSIGVRDAIKAGEPRLAPWIYTAGTIVDGVPPIWPGSAGLLTAEEAAAEVAAQQRAGFDFVKVYAKLAPETYGAIVTASAKAGLPVIGHVPSAVRLGGALESRQSTIEHLDGYTAYAERDDSPIKDSMDFLARVGAYKYADAAKLADAVARTKAAGTWNCPTLVVRDRIGKLDRPEATRPEYRFVPPNQLESWKPENDFRFRKWTARHFEDARGGTAWSLALVKQLSDAGAGILAGTDVGNPWLVPGFSLHQELELFALAKLTPFQALRAATSGPAEALGAEHEHGTVAVGRRADLLLVDGDPLADIKNTQRIAGVMLRGRWLPARELKEAQDAIAAIYRGERSRFPPAAPAAPPPQFRAHYRGVGLLAGEERVTATGKDGAWRIAGEARLDGSPDTRVELELGARNIGQRMRLVHDGLDVVMVREAGRVRVSGRYGADTIAVDESIAEDEILGGPLLAADAVFHRQLLAVAAGESITAKLAVLETRPRVHVEHMSIPVTRLPDATRTLAGKAIPVRVFELRLGFFGKQELAIDADGWPVSSTTHQRVD